MSNTFTLTTDELKENIPQMRAGDRVLLSGTIYTARDAAHKELFRLLDEGAALPFNIDGAVIYYAGPTPARDGQPVGSCGPTTSGRMDRFAPRLLDLGLAAMIGKGFRKPAVVESIQENGAVYFAATGGAGALIARCVKGARVLAFEDLGTEAIRELTVEDLPLIVAVDSQGNDLYAQGPARYARP